MSNTINSEGAGSSSANDPPHPIALLIDPQTMVGEGIRLMLADESDVEFHYCQDPHQAVSKANEIHPTTIIQELNIPNAGGYALLKAFRENPSTSGTPIIILSLRDDPKDKSHAFELGASDYLVKLPGRIEMVARIHAHSKTYVLQLNREQEYLEMKAQVNQLWDAAGL